MWNLIRYVTFPQFRQHLLRTVLTTAGIALGVAVIIAMRLVNASVFAAIRESVDDAAGRAVLSVVNGQAGFPEEILDRVRKVPGVKKAAALILDSGLVLSSEKKGERLQISERTTSPIRDSQVRVRREGRGDGGPGDGPLSARLDLRDPAIRRFACARVELPLELQTTTGPKRLTVRGILKETGPARAYGGMFALMDIYSAQIAFGRGHAARPGNSIRSTSSSMRASRPTRGRRESPERLKALQRWTDRRVEGSRSRDCSRR